MWVMVTVVVAVVVVATYVTWTAARVDRLHARADAAFSVLDAQSMRRAAATMDLGRRDQAVTQAGTVAEADMVAGAGTAAEADMVADADMVAGAETVADADMVAGAGTAAGEDRVAQAQAVAHAAATAVLDAHPDDREVAENDLTLALRQVTVATGTTDIPAIVEASRRLALARQVHSDLVRDALGVRQHPLVRLLGLARGHPRPRFFDIHDPTLEASGDSFASARYPRSTGDQGLAG